MSQPQVLCQDGRVTLICDSDVTTLTLEAWQSLIVAADDAVRDFRNRCVDEPVTEKRSTRARMRTLASGYAEWFKQHFS